MSLRQYGYNITSPRLQEIQSIVFRATYHRGKKTLVADLYPPLTITASGKPFGLYHTTTFFVNNELDWVDLLDFIKQSNKDFVFDNSLVVTSETEGVTPPAIKRSIGATPSRYEIPVSGSISYTTKQSPNNGETKVFKGFVKQR